MTRKTPDTPDPRKERLAAALRANLRRRKVQGRAQADEVTGNGDETASGPEL
ncbi:MAG TPA: hypothetical protein VF463_20975 [Sphingobium sp.]